MIDEIQALILALVAIAAGWYMGQRAARPGARDERSDFQSDYFRGLNYLLNEQPDKAIEVFCQMMEVNAETLETHFALGSLFRRRGEVDRAIRIHQNLIARPNLGRREHTLAMLELGKDYLKAGLFDRAESLFQELVQMAAHQDAAFRHLIGIYEQEKEWPRAIQSAQSLGRACPQTPLDKLNEQVAHYHCEMALLARNDGDDEGRDAHVREALAADPDSARGNLARGALEWEKGDFELARSHLLKVIEHDPVLFPLVRDRLRACYENLRELDAWVGLLDRAIAESPSIDLIRERVNHARAQEGIEVAEALARTMCDRYPTVDGLNTLMDLIHSRRAAAEAGEPHDLKLLSDVLGGIVEKQPGYRCGQCGFSSRAMHWQCPGCKTWGSIKPVEGEPIG